MNALFTLFEKAGRRDDAELRLGETQSNASFVYECTHGFSRWIIIAFVIALFGGMLQVVTFDFLGDLVDWLDASSSDRLLDSKGDELVLVAIAIAIVIPMITLVKNLLFHQLLGPNLQKNTIVKLYRTLIASPASYHEEDDPGSTAIVYRGHFRSYHRCCVAVLWLCWLSYRLFRCITFLCRQY